jgi:hypothetical protein
MVLQVIKKLSANPQQQEHDRYSQKPAAGNKQRCLIYKLLKPVGLT